VDNPIDSGRRQSEAVSTPVDEEDPMDSTTLLTLAVALIVVCSGYYLFNGVPHLRARRHDRSQRPPRR
jgi:hypothetical protein